MINRYDTKLDAGKKVTVRKMVKATYRNKVAKDLEVPVLEQMNDKEGRKQWKAYMKVSDIKKAFPKAWPKAYGHISNDAYKEIRILEG